MATRLFLAALFCSAAFAQRLEILSATYGTGVHVADLTNRVRGLVRNDVLAITVDTATLGEDPAPGQQKALHIRYRYDGKESLASAIDFGTIRVPAKSGFSVADLAVDRGGAAPAPAPVAPAPAVVAPATASPLRIVDAKYGWQNRQNDVRSRVEAMIVNGRASFRVDNGPLGGDPAIGKDKSLRVVYELNGSTYEVSQREGRTINIPDSGAKVVASAPAPVASAPAASSGPFSIAQLGSQPGVAPAANGAPAVIAGGPANVRVFSARYMRGSESIDLRSKIAPMVSNDQMSVRVDPGSLGVPGGGYLVVRYEYRGRTFEKAANDGQTLSLP